MRRLWALILTIFTVLGPVLSVHPALHLHYLRDGPPTSVNSTSSATATSTTPSTTSSSSSLTTSTTPSSSATSSSFTPSTSTSPTFSSSSSSESPFSSFSSSSAPSFSSSTSTQESSASQPTTSSTSQLTQSFSPTTSSVTSDTNSTSLSSQTRTTFTSTGTDGSLFTVTAIVSSPSDGSGSGPINTANQGFFANTGAVAGTFLVVGLVGTGVLICVFLWALRRYRRRKRDQAYFDDEYKEFNQPRERAGTPEATLPDLARESHLDLPVSSGSTPNMIEQLHGNVATVPNIPYDAFQYHAQPEEFDPYQNLGGPYAYSTDQAVYGQYSGSSQTGNAAFAYQPGTEFNGSLRQKQDIAGPSHLPPGAMVPHTL